MHCSLVESNSKLTLNEKGLFGTSLTWPRQYLGVVDNAEVDERHMIPSWYYLNILFMKININSWKTLKQMILKRIRRCLGLRLLGVFK